MAVSPTRDISRLHRGLVSQDSKSSVSGLAIEGYFAISHGLSTPFRSWACFIALTPAVYPDCCLQLTCIAPFHLGWPSLETIIPLSARLIVCTSAELRHGSAWVRGLPALSMQSDRRRSKTYQPRLIPQLPRQQIPYCPAIPSSRESLARKPYKSLFSSNCSFTIGMRTNGQGA